MEMTVFNLGNVLRGNLFKTLNAANMITKNK